MKTATPGPWEADVTDWPLLITRADDSDACIAQIHEAGRFWPDDETSRANARLIAAAPEMRELLALVDSASEANDHNAGKGRIAACEAFRALGDTARALLARIDGEGGGE